ncbi:hypothetical protein ACFLZN_00205 [Nanoarchaeota archaeon]
MTASVTSISKQVKTTMENELLIFGIIVCVVIARFYPDIWAKLVSGTAAVIGICIFAYLQFFVVDPIINEAIDVSVQVAEDLEIIDIPDSFCPTEFNRTSYCAEFALSKGELTGQAYLTGEINEVVDLRFETKDQVIRCPLEKGKVCRFVKINSIDDFKLTLTDKQGTAIIDSVSMRKQVKTVARALQLAKAGKFINRLI